MLSLLRPVETMGELRLVRDYIGSIGAVAGGDASIVRSLLGQSAAEPCGLTHHWLREPQPPHDPLGGAQGVAPWCRRIG